jgi:hypothetical protein
MIYVWILGLCVVFAAVLFWNFIPRRRRLRRFEGRDNLSLDEIYNQFFASTNLPKRLVLELWNEIAALLHVPPGKLRPLDRFDEELSSIKGWELDDETFELHWAAQQRLKKLSVDVDISSIVTLRDYVEFFCKLSAPMSAVSQNRPGRVE